MLLGSPRAAVLLSPSFDSTSPGVKPGLFFAIVTAPCRPGLHPAVAAPAAGSVLAAIGNTPLVELPHFSRGAARIFAKLEWFNPGGSVKDRIAKAMIEDAEKRGLLAAGGTIVEATSGNTGVALAMVAAAKHYRCVIVMPEGYGDMKARLMRGLGAEVVRTPSDAMMTGAIERANQIVRDTPGAFLPDQFYNPINPQTHYDTTGPEIAARGRRPDRRLGRRRRDDRDVHREWRATSRNAIPASCAWRSSRRAPSSAAALPGRTRSRASASRRSGRSSTARSWTRCSRSATRKPSTPAARSRARRAFSREAPPARPRPAPCASPSASAPERPSSRSCPTARSAIPTRASSPHSRPKG